MLTAFSVLAEGRGPDPSGLGGILILIGVILLVVGRPAPDCRVPAIARKGLDEVAVFL